jgi:hypothetical protein
MFWLTCTLSLHRRVSGGVDFNSSPGSAVDGHMRAFRGANMLVDGLRVV